MSDSDQCQSSKQGKLKEIKIIGIIIYQNCGNELQPVHCTYRLDHRQMLLTPYLTSNDLQAQIPKVKVLRAVKISLSAHEVINAKWFAR